MRSWTYHFNAASTEFRNLNDLQLKKKNIFTKHLKWTLRWWLGFNTGTLNIRSIYTVKSNYICNDTPTTNYRIVHQPNEPVSELWEEPESSEKTHSGSQGEFHTERTKLRFPPRTLLL